MQIFYAAPFIFFALSGFVVCLNRRNWQRFAYSALVAPISFALCSVLGLLLLALVWNFLKIKTVESTSVILGCFSYLACGLIGAVISVKAVRFIEQRFLQTRRTKNLVLRMVFSLIAVPIGFILGLIIAGAWLPPYSLEPTFVIAIFSGGIAALLAYFSTQLIQNRYAERQHANSTFHMDE